MYLFILIFYHDCIFINFYSNTVHKFPVYGTIKLYCIVLYCIVLYCIVLFTDLISTGYTLKPDTHLNRDTGMGCYVVLVKTTIKEAFSTSFTPICG